MNDLLSIFQSSPLIFIGFVTFISLLIGSFLNVVIARLPLILMRNWRKECFEYLELPNKDSDSKISLFLPRSYCPNCKATLLARDNIPILSYIILGGKCRTCKSHISIQYPLIESLTAILCMLVAWKFGVTWQTVAGCLLTQVLIAQSGIDFKHKIIPDEITLSVLWLGIIISIATIFCDSESSIIGAACGYLSLWLMYWLFYITTKKEGMGYGDFKLLAMLGAWLGWQMLPFIVIFSSILGSAVGLSLLLFTTSTRNTRIPFGPFLAIAGWLALMWGPDINDWYLIQTGLY